MTKSSNECDPRSHPFFAALSLRSSDPPALDTLNFPSTDSVVSLFSVTVPRESFAETGTIANATIIIVVVINPTRAFVVDARVRRRRATSIETSIETSIARPRRTTMTSTTTTRATE
tara:strand:- start:2150 stop:2500 length:351 start_codon:yes stop_codon:yes gene_type:complete